MNSIPLRFKLLCFLYGLNYLYVNTLGSSQIYPFLYFAAGLIGVLTVLALPLLGNDKLVFDVRVIQTFWIGIHGLGFFMYMIGLDPDFYDDFQTFLNLFQILWILWARHDTEDRCLHTDGFDGIHDVDIDLYRFNHKR